MCAFRCGTPVHKGHRLCKVHLEHQRIKMAEFRTERKRLGLCSRCDNPARILADGSISTLCAGCRTKVRDQEKVQRAKQAKKIKRILRLRAAGTTLKVICFKEKLSADKVKQILARAPA